MSLFQPKSILQLTAFGFMTVTALLVAAVVVTMRQVDGLSIRSRQTVTNVAEAMQSSRKLIEQSTAMDRNIKQYMVLGDSKLLDIYNVRRNEFYESAKSLTLLSISDEIRSYVSNLISNEKIAHEDLIKSGQDKEITTKYYGPVCSRGILVILFPLARSSLHRPGRVVGFCGPVYLIMIRRGVHK